MATFAFYMKAVWLFVCLAGAANAATCTKQEAAIGLAPEKLSILKNVNPIFECITGVKLAIDTTCKATFGPISESTTCAPLIITGTYSETGKIC